MPHTQFVKNAAHGPAPVQKRSETGQVVLDRPGPEPVTGRVLKFNLSMKLAKTGLEKFQKCH